MRQRRDEQLDTIKQRQKDRELGLLSKVEEEWAAVITRKDDKITQLEERIKELTALVENERQRVLETRTEMTLAMERDKLQLEREKR